MKRLRPVLALFAALLLGACNFGLFGVETDPAEAVCPCNCGTSDENDPCFVNCRAPFDVLGKTAHEAHCDDDLAAYAQCLGDEGECTDRSFSATSCGREFSSLTTCETNAGF